MIIFDEIKNKNDLLSWWDKMLLDVSHSYPITDFSKIDKNFKMNTCVDIGCNVGCFSYLASKHFTNIVAFEPGYYTSVIARMRLNQKEKIDNVFIHNLAVGENTGDILRLSCSIHDGKMNSGNASTVYSSSEENYELVTTISLEKIFQLCETDFIDYLKIDCEGSEYNILLEKDLTNIGIIVGEIHDHPSKDFETARKELLNYISNSFNLCTTKHNFFAVNKKFNIDPNIFFNGEKYETQSV
ncbi:MAG: FkbM family methyltransferase [Candidatus Hodarchaeales archaeon]|jgi:FkbM family methyltransferase